MRADLQGYSDALSNKELYNWLPFRTELYHRGQICTGHSQSLSQQWRQKKHRQELSMVLKSSVVPGRWQKRLTRSVVTHTKPSDESQMQYRSCMQGGRVGVGAAEGQRQGSRSQTSWNSGLPKQMGKTEAENEHSPWANVMAWMFIRLDPACAQSSPSRPALSFQRPWRRGRHNSSSLKANV